MSRLIQVTYISKSAQEFDDATLGKLMRHSRRNNARRDITGLLVMQPPRFIQVLEGAPEVVRALVEVIECDTRHTNFEVVSERAIRDREFGCWRMGCQVVAADAPLAELDDRVKAILRDSNPTSSDALTLLATLRDLDQTSACL
ncbi:MAG: BLUF domain-containing protein [Gammaproteobacteria bacterium]